MAEQRVEAPSANVDIDVKALPIGPEEAFVLSRVDGYATALEIAHSTGLPLERVQQILTRLEGLGAVYCSSTGAVSTRGSALRERFAPPASAVSACSPTTAEGHSVVSGVASTPSRAPSIPSAPAVGFSVVPDIDLTPDEQAAIWTAWSSLEKKNHYDLLGVPRDAPRSAIQEAYFARVASVHPDKHFGRRLGTYKQKLEVLFQHLTAAHQTLTRSRQRQAYDAQLPPLRPTSPARSVARAASVRPTFSETNRSAQTSAPPDRRVSSAAPQTTGGARSVRPSIVNGEVTRQAPSPGASDAERRLAAQRALERGLKAVGRSAPSKAPPPSAAPTALTSPELKTVPALERAKQAAARGDKLTAARSYASAAEQSDDCECFARAAEYFLQAASELSDPSLLRQAADNARRAVSKAPNSSRLRMTLSRVYADAGMVASSLREAERARQLVPEDPIIQNWLEQLKRKGA